jgi:DNA-binding IclR family transcriptional regulator
MTTVQSVNRAFALLDLIAAEPSGLSDLARQADLPISTVARLLGTLEALGAVERVDDVGLYRIGDQIVTLANSITQSDSLSAIAADDLESLSEQLGEAVGLAVPAGHNMHYIAEVVAEEAADNPVQIRDWVGTRLPMHTVSSGLVVLANWGADAVGAYLEGDLAAPTPRTITDPDVLADRLDDVRRGGVAWAWEEFEEGINSVATPLFSAGQVVAAVHAHGPAFRFPGTETEAIEGAVRSTGERINLLLS